MRISVKKDDPGHATYLELRDQDIRVMFNGEEIPSNHIVTADEGLAYIVRYRAVDGYPKLLAVHSEGPIEFFEYGEVKIIVEKRPYDAQLEIMKHVALVRELLHDFAVRLMQRGEVHDSSKLDPIELGPLQEIGRLNETEGKVAFGTPEYEIRKQILAPMLAHHYANNPHHPEHHEDGIRGMSLMDVVEMFCDWIAASRARNPDGVLRLTGDADKYDAGPVLQSIFQNTAEELGIKWQ
jgi:hypothetical protein